MKLTLFHYWRSSASWRVRWAFALKGIEHQLVPVSLLDGESESPEHLQRNPLGYVPTLAVDGRFLCESLAIIEWAEEFKPEPQLISGDAWSRAWIRQLAELINADTHPLQNLGPQHLHSEDPEKRKAWARHWIQNGLSAYEKLVSKSAGRFSVGDQVTLADLCLIPQMYNARRYELELAQWPTIHGIWDHAMATQACQASAPERFQPA